MTALKKGKRKNLVIVFSATTALYSLMVPLMAEALDFTPDTTRYISDPAYLTLQGQVYGTTGYDYERKTDDVKDAFGNKFASHTYSDNTVTQHLAYGVTDDLGIGITETYGWDRANTDYVYGPSATIDSNGFENPSIGGTWRALDQHNYPINLDIIAQYAPDLITARTGSITKDGTIARGGQTASLGAAVSYEMKSLTIYGSGNATFLGDRSNYNDANGLTTDYRSSWQYDLNLQTQTRLTDRFSINAGATETFNNNVAASFNNQTFTVNPGQVTSLNAALNYVIVPNQLVANLTYSHEFYNNNNVNYAFQFLNNSYSNENANIVGVRLEYLLY